MLRPMNIRHGLGIGALALCATACTDDTQERLNNTLKERGVKEVVVTETKITATCSSGATTTVNADELERNFMGMPKASKVTAVAKTIFKDCEDKDAEKHREEQIKAALAEQAKQLGVDATGMAEEEIKKAICDKLTSQLPLKDPERTVEGVKNQQRWGCPPPPPVAELPTGAWSVEVPKPQGKKPVQSFARLQNEDGNKLTVRCANKKADFYVQTQSVVKKGTKQIDAKVDLAKPVKWKVKPSTDGKALFFSDTKLSFSSLSRAQKLTLVIPTAKKNELVAFDVKGMGEALRQMPKGCQ